MQSAPASFRRADTPNIEQVRQAPGGGGVVTSLLVGKEESSLVAFFGGWEPELRVEEDGGGVPGEDLGDVNLELLEVGTAGGCATFLGERFLERSHAGPWRRRR